MEIFHAFFFRVGPTYSGRTVDRFGGQKRARSKERIKIKIKKNAKVVGRDGAGGEKMFKAEVEEGFFLPKTEFSG